MLSPVPHDLRTSISKSRKIVVDTSRIAFYLGMEVNRNVGKAGTVNVCPQILSGRGADLSRPRLIEPLSWPFRDGNKPQTHHLRNSQGSAALFTLLAQEPKTPPVLSRGDPQQKSPLGWQRKGAHQTRSHQGGMAWRTQHDPSSLAAWAAGTTPLSLLTPGLIFLAGG